MEKFKRNPLAASVMTGVTALLGGIEPASVAAETHSFSVSVSDTEHDNVTATTSGSFFDNTNTTAPTPFSKFNNQGGTLTLTQVVVNVITDPTKSQLKVDAKGTCGNDQANTSGGPCSSSLQNTSEFSALIELGSPPGIGLGADQDFSTALITPGCAFTAAQTCNYSGSDTSNPSVLLLSDTITGADLALFVGSGSFDVTPALGLGGPFTAFVPSIQGTPFNDYASDPDPMLNNFLSATTNWAGTIEVEYTFQQNGAVPEPATLFLFGTGLAGLGFLRRKPKGGA
jgi:hypothetical protein